MAIGIRIVDGEIASASRVSALDFEVPDNFFNTHPAYCFEYNGTELVFKADADSLRDVAAQARANVHTAKALASAVSAKVKAIDKQTGIDIVILVGDSTKQRNILATYLKAAKAGEDVSGYITLWDQVEGLRLEGNTREAGCKSALTLTELETI
jgi:F420-0:gamma-glutamyl ligase-like protein